MSKAVDRIVGRLSTQRYFDKFRRKAHDLRKIVAGDRSPIDATATPQNDTDAEDAAPKAYSASDLYDIFCQDLDEGMDNKILQAVKILVMQVGFRFPDIEFGDELTAAEAGFNSEYLKDRLGPQPIGCAGADHGRLTLTDYVTTGIGWLGTFLRDGVPIVSHCDTLDMTWDLQAQLITDIRWQSCKVRNPVYKWLELFKGKEAIFREVLGPTFDKDPNLDKSVTLEFYFDRLGADGTAAPFIVHDSGYVYNKPIEVTDNPYFYQVAGRKIPALPVVPMYYLQLMSVRQPIGIVEMMLANQMAIYESDTTIRDTVKRGKRFWDVEEGSYSDEELQKFERGETGAIMRRKKGFQPAKASEALEVTKSDLVWRELNERGLTAAGGTNPYSMGNRVDGVEFSSEVAAIEGHAGLVAGAVTTDYTSLWARVSQQLLAIAVEYDEAPISFYYDNARLEFDQSDPIKNYLRPDVTPTVREDATQFIPRQTQVAMAQRDLDVALQMAPLFPNAPKVAFEDYLRAGGKRNIAKYLEQPMAPAMPAGDPAAGAADAEASTAAL